MTRKKLLYLSAYRGFKEADVLIGGFVAWYLQTSPTDEELLKVEIYLEQDDSWLLEQMKAQPPPIPEDAMDQVSTLVGLSHRWYTTVHKTQNHHVKEREGVPCP